MKTRCFNRNADNYVDYGGRRITVCAEWMDFAVFQDWAINSGYADGLSIDRENNDGNYEPGNCRWVTEVIQSNNRRSNRRLEYRGEQLTLSQLARKADIHEETLRSRLNLGWSVERAVSQPLKNRGN